MATDVGRHLPISGRCASERPQRDILGFAITEPGAHVIELQLGCSSMAGCVNRLNRKVRIVSDKVLCGRAAMGAVKEHKVQQVEQTIESQVCDHALHAFGDNGRTVGTWIAASGPYGLRVSCKICGKLYGYSPVHTERTLQQLYKAYNEQRNGLTNCVG